MPFSLVPETGLEPVRCCHHGILSPGRLPVPPLGQIKKPIQFALKAVMGLLEAPPGLEPGVKALQASALPLGYGAVLSYNMRYDPEPLPNILERKTRFELATFALARQRSTTEPLPHGGSYRARTCDPLLVRQMLSQLS